MTAGGKEEVYIVGARETTDERFSCGKEKRGARRVVERVDRGRQKLYGARDLVFDA